MGCGFAQTLPQLIIARAVQGLGGAALFSMAQAAVADVVAPRERGRYQGYMASMWGVSSIAGPILGGWATDHLSWRWIFWANLPVGLVAFVLCDAALRMIRTQRRKLQMDSLGRATARSGRHRLAADAELGRGGDAVAFRRRLPRWPCSA